MIEQTETHRITVLLSQIAHGDSRARDELISAVYQQLRKIAQVRMSAEHPDHTLQATALVHEAYLKLAQDLGGSVIKNRHDFFGAAAEAMRRILIDHARRRGTEKRGGGFVRVPIESVAELADRADPQAVIAVDEAFEILEAEQPRCADVVRLRFFAGLSVEETAGVLGISAPTVKRRWRLARAMLFEILERKARGD